MALLSPRPEAPAFLFVYRFRSRAEVARFFQLHPVASYGLATPVAVVAVPLAAGSSG